MPTIVRGIAVPTLDELQHMVNSGALVIDSGRKLTPQERQQAHADRLERASRFDIGDESESRGKGWLQRFFRAEVRKNPLRQINTLAGPQWVSQEVDFTIYRPVANGQRRTVRITDVEVKGTLGDSFPLARISDRERSFLDRSASRGHDTWILCLWWHKTDTAPDCDLMHLIPWIEWRQIEADLRDRANGNFKGKSIRKIDRKGWDIYAIRKIGSRWHLDPSHWLHSIMSIDEQGTQITLIRE
jgi:hypothetical protein